jgi:large conductance mechanosensitive channel
MGFVSEFKEFISKGNVLDLAVGVIIGAAFGKIVSSLTDDIIMPIVGLGTGKLGEYQKIMVGPMKVGLFLAAVLDFFIIAFCVFMIVKGANSIKKKPVEVVAAPATPPPPTTDQQLLMEIRDALRTGRA